MMKSLLPKVLTIAGIAISSSFQLLSQQKPNIIFILADDLGYGDLSCYNPASGIITPNIDKIAEDGVKFNNFYAAASISSPSRRAILTGRYPSRLGEWAEGYPTTPTDTAISTFAEPCFPIYLKKAGYTNGMFGKWNIGSVNGVSTPDAHGFDYWIGSMHSISHFGHRRDNGVLDFFENGKPAPQYEGLFADDVFVDKAIDFIKDSKQKPFFVYLSFLTPHSPFQDPTNPIESDDKLGWWNRAGASEKQGKQPPKWEDRPVMKKMIEHIDGRIGDLMNTLIELGIEQNTIIIFTSDNGGTPASINLPLSGFKQGLLEGGIRVPTLIKWPIVLPKGVLSDQTFISMDLSRTIISVAKADKYIPEGRVLDGINLVPIITDKAKPKDRVLAWRRRDWGQIRNDVWAEVLIKGEWKYIKEFQETPVYAKSIMGDYPEKGFVELLFHLKSDVSEKENLAEKYPKKLKEMRIEYEKWRDETVNKDKYYQIPKPDQYQKKITK
jgi:arylsulfatase A-like enzyme